MIAVYGTLVKVLHQKLIKILYKKRDQFCNMKKIQKDKDIHSN